MAITSRPEASRATCLIGLRRPACGRAVSAVLVGGGQGGWGGGLSCSRAGGRSQYELPPHCGRVLLERIAVDLTRL